MYSASKYRFFQLLLHIARSRRLRWASLDNGSYQLLAFTSKIRSSISFMGFPLSLTVINSSSPNIAITVFVAVSYDTAQALAC